MNDLWRGIVAGAVLVIIMCAVSTLLVLLLLSIGADPLG